ncbi:cytochrome c oxidase subunit 3 [Pedobacter antarcticus]|uniref:Cytochrome C oxidase subunit III n=2 Tax=Pedobacter antarcticus TaxID=34086 RepID=A0A081PGU9_9SPHI|nr:cytochrome c oxidase subunit 3 [Pedobacter antarcticus]KEQ29922.1 cytochrome C oxidase subunit III [Pedobacter antarcticus 4BY]SDL98405.1 cytochrome c oxidase subunit 3 [Pedobacter antarcticus]SFE79510.1 cytochrome c oxidase subunit 3 [Pedobacter antarcticus]
MVHTLKQEDVEHDLQSSTKAKKFVLWLFVVSSTIMFGGFTSYYIVFAASKGKGHGLVLPDMFTYSTLVLVLSSICLFFAARAVRQQNISAQRSLLWVTLALGLGFGYLQVDAWSALYQTGATLVNNNAAISVIYIVSGMHLLHIFAGVCFILNSLWGSYTKVPQENAVYRIEIASIFWHFIDILWIYLYVFLLLNS